MNKLNKANAFLTFVLAALLVIQSVQAFCGMYSGRYGLGIEFACIAFYFFARGLAEREEMHRK